MSTQKSDNNKRIVKNTALLYVRMIITMLVSLYTARMTLRLLGVEDYGINNVVAGIINFTGVITGTMVQATQRFLAFDLGKNDIGHFKLSYSMLTNIFLIICIFSVIIMEIVGPWFVGSNLVLPDSRVFAAQIVFQFTIFNFVLDTMNVPNTAAIVAYEKMGIYAYFTILDVLFKLLVVYALYITPFDKLITYGALGCFLCLLRNIIIHFYCNKKIEGCKYRLCWDKTYIKQIYGYISWSLLGSLNSVLMGQGQAIILNIFFGPLVNAAKAIGDRIKSIIYSFVTNFYMAVTPQIIKSYASGDIDYTKKIVLNSSKYAFYLLLVLSAPIMLNMKPLLCLWLGANYVTNEMVIFSVLTLIYSLIAVLECPMTKVVQATGKVRKYELFVGLITLGFIPLCYVMFLCGGKAYYSMILLCIIYFCAQIYRVKYASKVLRFTFYDYSLMVFYPITKVVVLVWVIQYLPRLIDNEFLNLIMSLLLGLGWSLLVIFLVGINNKERNYVINFVKIKFRHA